MKIDIEKNKVNHPFKVPENYFVTLENEIFLKKSKNKTNFWYSIFLSPKFKISLAISFILIFCAIYFYPYFLEKDNVLPKNNNSLATIPQQDIIYYLEISEWNDFDEWDLINIDKIKYDAIE